MKSHFVASVAEDEQVNRCSSISNINANWFSTSKYIQVDKSVYIYNQEICIQEQRNFDPLK